MNRFKSPSLALAVGMLGLAAVLGGSLGFAVARTGAPLSTGVNPTVGGPLRESMAPAKFLSCLPAGSWSSLYIWDKENQRWLHYFSTASGVPAYVNDARVGGITVIPQGSGVALIMNMAVSSPVFPDRSSEACS